MSLTVFRLAARLSAHLYRKWRPLLARAAALAAPAEPAPHAYPFAPTDVAQLQRLTPHDRADALDDATWRDLLLDRYGERLSVDTSIFGRQVLYRRLRNGSGGGEAALRRARIETLLADPARLASLHHGLRALRRADVEVAGLLFGQGGAAILAPQPPGWLRVWFLIPLLLAASVAAALLLSPVAWIGTAVAMLLLVAPQMRYRERMEEWGRLGAALQMMLRVCSLLDGSAHPLAGDFTGRGKPAGRISRRLTPSPMADLALVKDYLHWFLLANVRHYFKSTRLALERRAFLCECYDLCANLEADVALARHLLAAPAWCWARRSDAEARALALEGAVHPLVEGASALSIALDGKGAFLSGQNGVGKSTFLRTLGLNLAAARAFGFCYARSASLPPVPVVAGMHNEDSLLGGQSLYVAELARARELLAAAGGERPVICLIDEIFRGTNHEESVSAAAAVLDELARRALVVVSSHNLVLGPLLAHRLAPWRVGTGADGVLRLEPGVLGRTNGIALLAEHGFDPAVQDKAGKVAGWLARQRGGGAGADLLDDAVR